MSTATAAGLPLVGANISREMWILLSRVSDHERLVNILLVQVVVLALKYYDDQIC